MRFPAAVLLMVMACARGPAVSAPTEAGPAPATGPRVIFPDGQVVRVEIAADDPTRAQGLMYRDHLEPASGMLFFFPAVGDYPFWMKNTLIPLDMIWIDSDKRVVRVKHDVPPCKIDDCPSYPPDALALYVLEVAAGVAKQHGLKEGRHPALRTDRERGRCVPIG